MIDNIIIVVEKSLIAVFAVVGYFYLVCSLIPHLTLRPVWREEAGRARGLSRVTFPTGRGVIYEPDPKVRRYLRQYALLLQDGHKLLQCRIDSHIRYLRYDVATFDREGRLLDIVRVSERVSTPGVTRRVSLPTATAHAYIVLRRVDGMYRSRERVVRYSLPRLIAMPILTVAVTLGAAFLLYDSVARIWALCYPRLTGASLGTVLAWAAVVGVAVAGWMLLSHRLRNWRAINR